MSAAAFFIDKCPTAKPVRRDGHKVYDVQGETAIAALCRTAGLGMASTRHSKGQQAQGQPRLSYAA
jgi:hypothetical protein